MVAVAIAAYARWLFDPSLECGFTFDDHLGVVNNADVDTSKTTAAQTWQNDIWGKDLRKIDSHKSWRPLLIFSFRLSHAAAGGFDARAFHLPGALLTRLCSPFNHAKQQWRGAARSARSPFHADVQACGCTRR